MSSPHHFDERGFEATRNVRGFMHTLNKISQAFIDFAASSPGLIVDMGAAYGVATLPILKKHIEVIACDVDKAHLDELTKRVEPPFLPYLKTQVGYFPREIDFAENSVGAILLSHILPYLDPKEMDLTFNKLAKWLAPNGKVFIVCYSPYLACFKQFIPIYEKRVAEGIKWPSWVENNVRDYLEAPQDVLDNLPDTMNYLDLPPLIQALESNGFSIETAEYLDPKMTMIPDGVLLDGREWVGIVAIRI